MLCGLPKQQNLGTNRKYGMIGKLNSGKTNGLGLLVLLFNIGMCTSYQMSKTLVLLMPRMDPNLKLPLGGALAMS
jgi:hypothetical protein